MQITDELSFLLKMFQQKADIVVSSSCASRYAEKYRYIDGALLTFKGREYLRYIHDIQCEEICIPKAAQIGLSVSAENRFLFDVDIRKKDVLYLLPTMHDAQRFVSGRLDPLLDESPYFKNLFKDVDNTYHKRSGRVNLYISGTRSPNVLKGIPVSSVYLDEYEEISDSSVALAEERVSGRSAEDRFKMYFSTPRIASKGIWAKWMTSAQHFWYIKCPNLACEHSQRLIWPDNVVFDGDVKNVEASLICTKCKRVMPENSKHLWIDNGKWIIENNMNAFCKGFHISQLYSFRMDINSIVRKFLSDKLSDKVEFFNSKLGLPYVPEGGQLTTDLVVSCIRSELKVKNDAQSSVMGVDVSSVGNHYAEILEILPSGYDLVLRILRPTWEDLPKLMQQFNVRLCIIDAAPERAVARAFANMFPDRVLLAFFPEGLKVLYNVHEEKNIIDIHRSEAFDLIQEGFRIKSTILTPFQEMDTYSKHLCSPIKTFKADRYGIPQPRYVSDGEDHYALAHLYAKVASIVSPHEDEKFLHTPPKKDYDLHPGSIFNF